MAKLTQTDVGREVAKANAIYQPPDGRCAATPKQLQALLDRLEQVTEDVQSAAASNGLVDAASDPDAGGAAQWAADMAAWQTRLFGYQAALDQIGKMQYDSNSGCIDVRPWVTSPLLDGVYYQWARGIVFDAAELAGFAQTPVQPSNRKPPDIATPFMLGNQVLVYGEWQLERFKKFLADLIQPPPFEPPWWMWWAVGGALALVAGSVSFGLYARVRGPQHNPKGVHRTRTVALPGGGKAIEHKGSHRIESKDLKPGYRVRAPQKVRDEDGKWVPLSAIWPDHPDVLVVRAWDWDDGTSVLGDPGSSAHLDLNIADYPRHFVAAA